jgi:hypothetical protein
MNECIISNDAFPVMIECEEAPQGLEPMKHTHTEDPFAVDDEYLGGAMPMKQFPTTTDVLWLSIAEGTGKCICEIT